MTNLFAHSITSLSDSEMSSALKTTVRGSSSWTEPRKYSSEWPYSVLKTSMNHLAEHFSLGSPVVEPVRSTNGRLVEEVVSTEGERHLVTVTGAAPGRTHEFLARDTISDDLLARRRRMAQALLRRKKG
jgi:hypothetical protein